MLAVISTGATKDTFSAAVVVIVVIMVIMVIGH